MKTRKSYIRLLIYLLLLGATFCLGILGFYQYHNALNQSYSLWGIFYDVLRLFAIEHDYNEEMVPLSLNIARFLAPLLLATALINIFYTYLNRQLLLFRIRYFYNNHIVICGLGLKTKLIVEHNSNLKEKIIILEINPENPYILDVASAGVKVLKADATNSRDLLNAGICRAKKVFVNTGSDLINLNVAGKIIEVVNRRSGGIAEQRLRIMIDITDSANEKLLNHLQEAIFTNKKGAREKQNKKRMPHGLSTTDITSFNIYSVFASRLIDKYSPDQYSCLNNTDSPPAHILIYGLEKMGMNILIQTAFIYHFANLNKTKISVIDHNIQEKRQILITSWPAIEEILDITYYDEAEFRFENPELSDVLLCFAAKPADAQNYLFSQRLRQAFFTQNYLRLSELQRKRLNESDNIKHSLLSEPRIVLVSSDYEDTFSLMSDELAQENDSGKYGFRHLRIDIERMFPMVCSDYKLFYGTPDTDIVAKAIHEQYQSMDTADFYSKWENLTNDEKDRNRYPARHAAIKLRYLGYELTAPDDPREKSELYIAPPQAEVLSKWEHLRWLAEKRLSYFVKGSEISDVSFYKEFLKNYLRWHKDIIPYEDLDNIAQIKDEKVTDFTKIIKSVDRMKLVKYKTKTHANIQTQSD